MQATDQQPKPSAKEIYLGHLLKAKNRYAECLKASREVWSEYYSEEHLAAMPELIKDTAATFFIECNRRA
jgi:hypothetical protein